VLATSGLARVSPVPGMIGVGLKDWLFREKVTFVDFVSSVKRRGFRHFCLRILITNQGELSDS